MTWPPFSTTGPAPCPSRQPAVSRAAWSETGDGSDTGDTSSHLSGDYTTSVSELVGVADDTARHDTSSCHLSSAWLAALNSGSSQVKADRVSDINVLVAAGRVIDTLMYMFHKHAAHLIRADQDETDQAEFDAKTAVDAVTARLGFYQLLAAGWDVKTSSVLST